MAYARSLTLTGALVLASIVCVFLGAAPTGRNELPAASAASAAAPLIAQRGKPPLAPIVSGPPVTFADPDGQELILEQLSVRTAIHGMLSLTELDFRFRNPKGRAIEGRFACTLPANAAISRFAKDVHGNLMEGEVVERLRANQVYEQYLHQMRDPALLEQDQGNRFTARIFPIAANAPVQIVLSYTTLLPMRGGVRTYSLPLRGLTNVGKFSFRAFVTPLEGEASTASAGGMKRSTAEVFSIDETDFTPTEDITLAWRPSNDAPRARVLRAGDFYLASFRPRVSAKATAAHSDWLFYIDTSASSAEGAEHRIRALERLLASLPAGDRVEVRAFDQELTTLGSGSAREMSRAIAGLLRERLFLGGTDVGALLRDVARAANERPQRAIVLASDLVATVGATQPNELHAAIRALPATSTVHALILGSRRDAARAKAITAGRGRIVDVPFSESIDAEAALAAEELRMPVGASIDVSDTGAEWIHPTRVDDVHEGDEVIVLAKVRAGAEPRASIGGEIPTAERLQSSTFGPLLEREAYRAYLDYLAEREAAEPSDAVRRALATEQVRISIEQRVVIPRTTMLVLESEWEYQRFGLDRRALAAILTIEAGGIGRIDRQRPRIANVPMPVMPPMAPPRVRPMEVPKMSTESDAGAMRDASADEISVAAPSPATTSTHAVGEAISVGGSAAGTFAQMPAGVPRQERAIGVPPPPPPPPPAPEPKRSDASWIRPKRPTRAQAAALEEKLARNPRDRALYNELSEVLAALGAWRELRSLALRWQPYDPENPQVYEVLGMAGEHLDNKAEAARAHGSLIELAPNKPELLQRAGLLLLRTGHARIAETPLRRALELRPDRVNSYRHLALMLWLDGRVEEAARVLESATRQQFPEWYGDAQRVVREELGYVYRAWLRRDPTLRRELEARAGDLGVSLDRRDSLRVSLAWETDANDVDLHVVDPSGAECFYGHRKNASGIELYEDITEGLGPEVVRGREIERGTYHVGVRYFNSGPMGVSRGIVVVLRDSGDHRDPAVEIHPFRLLEGEEEIRYVTSVKVAS